VGTFPCRVPSILAGMPMPENSLTLAPVLHRVRRYAKGKNSATTEKAGISVGMLKSEFHEIGSIGGYAVTVRWLAQQSNSFFA
jgi:hypothetical protein